MSTISKYDLLNGFLKLTYSSNPILQIQSRNGNIHTIDSNFLKLCTLCGFGFLVYQSKYLFTGFWNLSKFVFRKLFSNTLDLDGELIHYAIIYGANSQIGQIFASFLAGKRYNLILIDSSLDLLNKFSASLTNQGFQGNIIPICIEGDFIDKSKNENEIKNGLYDIKPDINIQLFINVKNLKLQPPIMFHKLHFGDLKLMMDWNVNIYLLLLKKSLQSMVKNKKGYIIDISTVNEKETWASKFNPLLYSSIIFRENLCHYLDNIYRLNGIKFLKINLESNIEESRLLTLPLDIFNQLSSGIK